MSDKNIYEILNNVDLNTDEIEDISEFEKEKIKRNFKKYKEEEDVKMKTNNRFKKGVMTAALALLIAVSSQTNTGKQVYASAKSKLDDLGYSISMALNTEDELESYSNIVDREVNDNGISIKLDEVIIDNDELVVSSLIESENKNMNIRNFDYRIYADGKRINPSSSFGHFGKVDGQDNIFYDLNIIDLDNTDLSDDVNLSIIIDKVYVTVNENNLLKEETIKGNWSFDFIANTSELKTATQVKKINHKFETDSTNYVIEEIRINPVSQKIYATSSNKDSLEDNLLLKGEDNFGNKLEFSLSKASSGNLVFRYESIDGAFNEDVSSIKLTPYASNMSDSGQEINTWRQVGDSFTINLK